MAEVAKTIGRRLFAKATVGLPAALKFGGHSPPRGLAVCGVPATTVGELQASAAEIAKEQFRSKVWTALRSKGRDAQERESVRDTRRMMMGGLDPDLSVLNSMSLARRVQIQLEREVEVRERSKGLRAWIIRSMGGNPEDFE